MTAERDSTMTLSTEEKVKIIIGAVAANGGFAALAADEIMGLMHEQQVGDGLCIVTQEDGNNYCQILSLLGMEEEGDPVSWVEAHLYRDAVVSDEDVELACRVYNKAPGHTNTSGYATPHMMRAALESLASRKVARDALESELTHFVDGLGWVVQCSRIKEYNKQRIEQGHG
jgi:hypothetical protein